MSKSGADAILDHLVAEGVEYIFVGPPTNHQFAFLDALYDRQDVIKPILVRHEAMAPWMAEGWFRMTGRPGVFHVGAGPALANTVIGMMTAYTCGSGVVGISGNVNSEFVGRNGMQEVQGKSFSEGHRILEPVVKKLWHVTRAGKLPEVMSQAFSAAVSGRPGPVLVDVPMDVFEDECATDVLPPATHRPAGPPAGNPEAIAASLDLILQAKAPVLLCGGGVIAARAAGEVPKLAEALNLPVVTSYTGKGSIPDDHPLSAGPVGAMGVPGGMAAVKEADLIVALGHRFSEHSTSGWEPGNPYDFSSNKLVQVDIQADEIGRWYPASVGIVGDIRLVLLAWNRAIEECGLRRARNDTVWNRTADRRATDRARFQDEIARTEGPIRPERVVQELRRALPRDAVLLPDAGNNGNYFNTMWDVFEPSTFVTDRGSAAMGYAPAAALGVKLAMPDRDVVVVTGDGCMTQVNWVLGTAGEYGIAVKIIVLNDAALAGCLNAQRYIFGGRVICTEFMRHGHSQLLGQDFALLAQSYQVEGERVVGPEQISTAIERMIKAPGPYLLDIVIDRHARPIGAGRMKLTKKQA